MSGKSKIEWTGATWNPIRARLKAPIERPATKDAPLKILPAGTWGYHCERVSPGCGRCYACTLNGRTLPAWGTGLDYTVPNRDKVEIYLDEEELLKPLHWKNPRKIFPCSMTDMFADFVPDEFIDLMLAAMALSSQHSFQCLTKRAARMRTHMDRCHAMVNGPGFFDSALADATRRVSMAAGHWLPGNAPLAWWENSEDKSIHRTVGFPARNIWLGVSVEDQQRADERIQHLLVTPAAIRWVSYEPALEPVDFTRIKEALRGESYQIVSALESKDTLNKGTPRHRLDWIVVGGESGPGARPFDLQWARDVIDQCAAAGVACFVKQLGAKPYDTDFDGALKRDSTVNIAARRAPYLQGFTTVHTPDGPGRNIRYLRLKDRKGGDISEWSQELRVREMPEARP